jgi:outer membrane protein assembly factor BamB
VCLATKDGKEVWRKNLPQTHGAKMMSPWHFCESPCVDDGRVVVTPGVATAMMVAFDAADGKELWVCKAPGDLGPAGQDGAAYSSIVVATVHGVKQYIQQVGRGLIGVDARTGRLLWHYNRIASRTANVMDVVVRGPTVFVSNSYTMGSALVELQVDKGVWTVKERYFLRPRQFENHHGGVVAVGDYLFGGSGQNRGDPVCIHIPTGQVMWRQKAPCNGSASVVYADGHIIWRYDRGEIYLTEANAHGWRVRGRFREEREQPGARWTHPVVFDGKLFLRHHNTLRCYALK